MRLASVVIARVATRTDEHRGHEEQSAEHGHRIHSSSPSSSRPSTVCPA
jgi:hypothetical protein